MLSITYENQQCLRSRSSGTYIFPFTLLSCITSRPQFLLSPVLPVLPPPPPISHRSTPPPFPFKQKCRPPRDISKHSTTSYSKTRRKPSQEGWMRQPSRRKRFPRIGERVRDMPCIPTVRSPARTPSYTTTLVYAEDLLAQI